MLIWKCTFHKPSELISWINSQKQGVKIREREREKGGIKCNLAYFIRQEGLIQLWDVYGKVDGMSRWGTNDVTICKLVSFQDSNLTSFHLSFHLSTFLLVPRIPEDRKNIYRAGFWYEGSWTNLDWQQTYGTFLGKRSYHRSFFFLP